MEKGSNTIEEALDALLEFFFVVTKNKDDMLRLGDMVKEDFSEYLNAKVSDLRDSTLRVYGEEYIVKEVRKHKHKYGLVKRRFKDIPEKVWNTTGEFNYEDEIEMNKLGNYQSGARVRF